MAVNSERSMNTGMLAGALDGKVRVRRPNTIGGDASHAATLGSTLSPTHYGSLGVSDTTEDLVSRAQLPDAEARAAVTALGVRGYAR